MDDKDMRPRRVTAVDRTVGTEGQGQGRGRWYVNGEALQNFFYTFLGKKSLQY